MLSKLTSSIAVALFTLILMLGLNGCNTMSGIGEDLEAAGDAIEDEAEENKTY